jgi:hypothetical protein
MFMILKLEGLLYFLTEGKAAQDIYSSSVVMLLSETPSDVYSALELRKGQTDTGIVVAC